MEELLQSLNSYDQLSEVGKNAWRPIIQKIEDTFIEKKHYKDNLHWGWLRLKEPVHVLSLVKHSESYLMHLVKDERVWFITEDYKDKLWLYEGKPEFIIKNIIPELMQLKEYYIVSKKYEWMICVNHHDTVYGTGEAALTNMDKFEKKFPEAVTKR